MDGTVEIVVRTSGTVHLLDTTDHPICNPDGPAMTWVDGVGWDGVGMWEVHCAACEELRQKEQLGRSQ
jgi:hypothetical protein